MKLPPDEPMPQSEIDPIAALYREASGEQPSARHDALVLAAARAELAATASSKAGALRKWRVPVAFAATLILTVALTLTVEREQPRNDTVVPALPSLETPAASPQPAAGPNAPAQSRMEQSLQRTAPGEAKEKTGAQRAQPAPVAGKLDAPVPAVAPVAPEPPVEALKPQYVPPPPDTGNARDAAPAQSDFAPALKKQLSAPPAPSSAPQPAPAATAPARPPADSVQRSRNSENGAGILLQNKSGAFQAPLSPQEWMDRIRTLHRAGRDADADAALRQFRLAFPDYPVPEDVLAKPQP